MKTLTVFVSQSSSQMLEVGNAVALRRGKNKWIVGKVTMVNSRFVYVTLGDPNYVERLNGEQQLNAVLVRRNTVAGTELTDKTLNKYLLVADREEAARLIKGEELTSKKMPKKRRSSLDDEIDDSTIRDMRQRSRAKADVKSVAKVKADTELAVPKTNRVNAKVKPDDAGTGTKTKSKVRSSKSISTPNRFKKGDMIAQRIAKNKWRLGTVVQSTTKSINVNFGEVKERIANTDFGSVALTLKSKNLIGEATDRKVRANTYKNELIRVNNIIKQG